MACRDVPGRCSRAASEPPPASGSLLPVPTGKAAASRFGAMTSQQDSAERFLALHHGPGPLLIPNPWDVGSARVLEWLGFSALATTSSGFAATMGRLDGSVTRDEALAHAAAIAAATVLPVSADLEDGFSASPEGVAETVRLAGRPGLVRR